MSHLLDGCWEKIKRADESIRHLNIELAALERAIPHEVVRKFQKQGREYCFIVKGDPTVPPRIAVLAGEIIHQLRSSLDHLVTALVLQTGGQPTRKHGFPVYSTEEKYTAACTHGCIKGITSTAADLIRAEQPYHRSPPNNHVLAAIDEFDRTDKHTLLLVVTAAAVIGHELRASADEAVTITGMTPPDRKKISKEGVKVFGIDVLPPNPKLQVDADIVFTIAFEKCGPVELVAVSDILRGMWDYTARVVHSFAGEFA